MIDATQLPRGLREICVECPASLFCVTDTKCSVRECIVCSRIVSMGFSRPTKWMRATGDAFFEAVRQCCSRQYTATFFCVGPVGAHNCYHCTPAGADGVEQ
jgi:hypothetical protein